MIDVLKQRPPLNILHGEIRFCAVFVFRPASFIDLGDAGVLKLSEDLDFVLKPTKEGL